MHRLGTRDSYVCAETRLSRLEVHVFLQFSFRLSKISRGEHHAASFMLKELVLMEHLWHREAHVTSVFEGLHLLAREFSLHPRAEVSFFRTEFLAKTYKASEGVTQVSDIFRQIDVGLSRFRKMIETLPATVSRVGLEIQTSDLTVMPSCFCVRCHMMFVHTALCMRQVMLILIFVLQRCVLRRSNACFGELGGPSFSGARGVHALEGGETAEEWRGYDQEGYDA